MNVGRDFGNPAAWIMEQECEEAENCLDNGTGNARKRKTVWKWNR